MWAGRFDVPDIPNIFLGLPLVERSIDFNSSTGAIFTPTTPPPLGYHPHFSIRASQQSPILAKVGSKTMER